MQMREVEYQLLARRQTLLVHQRCGAELCNRTEFLGYVYQAIKHQLRGDGIESLLHVIRARMAQYKEGLPQVLTLEAVCYRNKIVAVCVYHLLLGEPR